MDDWLKDNPDIVVDESLDSICATIKFDSIKEKTIHKMTKTEDGWAIIPSEQSDFSIPLVGLYLHEDKEFLDDVYSMNYKIEKEKLNMYNIDLTWLKNFHKIYYRFVTREIGQKIEYRLVKNKKFYAIQSKEAIGDQFIDGYKIFNFQTNKIITIENISHINKEISLKSMVKNIFPDN